MEINKQLQQYKDSLGTSIGAQSVETSGVDKYLKTCLLSSPRTLALLLHIDDKHVLGQPDCNQRRPMAWEVCLGRGRGQENKLLGIMNRDMGLGNTYVVMPYEMVKVNQAGQILGQNTSSVDASGNSFDVRTSEFSPDSVSSILKDESGAEEKGIYMGRAKRLSLEAARQFFDLVSVRGADDYRHTFDALGPNPGDEEAHAHLVLAKALGKIGIMGSEQAMLGLLWENSNTNMETGKPLSSQDLFRETRKLLQTLSPVRLAFVDGLHRIFYVANICAGVVPSKTNPIEVIQIPSSLVKNATESGLPACWKQIIGACSVEFVAKCHPQQVCGKSSQFFDKGLVLFAKRQSHQLQNNVASAAPRNLANSITTALDLADEIMQQDRVLMTRNDIFNSKGTNYFQGCLRAKIVGLFRAFTHEDNMPTRCWLNEYEKAKTSKKSAEEAFLSCISWQKPLYPVRAHSTKTLLPFLNLVSFLVVYAFDEESIRKVNLLVNRMSEPYKELTQLLGRKNIGRGGAPIPLWDVTSHDNSLTEVSDEIHARFIAPLLELVPATLAADQDVDEVAAQNCTRLHLCTGHQLSAELTKVYYNYGFELPWEPFRRLGCTEKTFEFPTAAKPPVSAPTRAIFKVIVGLLRSKILQVEMTGDFVGSGATKVPSTPTRKNESSYPEGFTLHDFCPTFGFNSKTMDTWGVNLKTREHSSADLGLTRIVGMGQGPWLSLSELVEVLLFGVRSPETGQVDTNGMPQAFWHVLASAYEDYVSGDRTPSHSKDGESEEVNQTPKRRRNEAVKEEVTDKSIPVGEKSDRPRKRNRYGNLPFAGGTSTKEPVTKEPVTKKPATKKPATKKPATKKPATKKPATKKPVTGPGTENPAKEATVQSNPGQKSGVSPVGLNRARSKSGEFYPESGSHSQDAAETSSVENAPAQDPIKVTSGRQAELESFLCHIFDLKQSSTTMPGPVEKVSASKDVATRMQELHRKYFPTTLMESSLQLQEKVDIAPGTPPVSSSVSSPSIMPEMVAKDLYQALADKYNIKKGNYCTRHALDKFLGSLRDHPENWNQFQMTLKRVLAQRWKRTQQVTLSDVAEDILVAKRIYETYDKMVCDEFDD